ncbi:MAG: DUF6867 family protein [Beijerinckiaceae bacterium]
MNLLWESGEYGVLTFLFLTLALGGAAATATGRALALTWRPWWQCILYAAPLALAIAFLHYAIFEEPAISIEAITEQVASADNSAAVAGAIAWNMRGWAVLFVLFAAFSLAGFRVTRVFQMTRQYRFAYAASGLFGWRKIS